MRRLLIITIFVVGLSLSATDSAFSQAPAPAQTPEPVKLAEPAPWLAAGDFRRGGLLASGGLIGALVTTFFLVGGVVPGTKGQAKIDADNKRLEELYKRLAELIGAVPIEAEAVKVVETTVNNLRDDLRSETWRQYIIASFLYTILGAAISALLAHDLLQALVIGAGWTSFLGNLGLKSDFAERKSQKDSALEETLSLIKKMQTQPAAAGQPAAPAVPDSIERLERKVRVAQAL